MLTFTTTKCFFPKELDLWYEMETLLLALVMQCLELELENALYWLVTDKVWQVGHVPWAPNERECHWAVSIKIEKVEALIDPQK